MLKVLQIILHICRIIFIKLIILAIQSEKVAVQDDTDTLQQTGINALALEDIVHIGAVAV